ncbi:MAG: ATP-dependent DNA helicase RecG [Pseudomonadales bacterium]|jgi:ATP-dependent DNA helicase RecG|nr:ATP-dependent DNA helicase RecG [Pseudomonadales bacterium]MDP6469426.1 ATP-dependent DNA helicase RecG [Pseudomonadales bacterium]MDP6827268.1 ATP-dependent DNA helicase RecG [Pseudomonadales bacterium]MDP6971091.1 ATP-dependent DNA helicase RecG [Pseudomonadales bacterium]
MPERAPGELPVTELKGVGPGLAAKLATLGIYRLGDLLLHLPLRYQDRTRIVPMHELRPGDECLVEGTVVANRLAYGRRRSWTLLIEDDTGRVMLRFFHFSRQQQSNVYEGQTIRCFGEVRFGPTGLEMAHPEYRVHHAPPPPPEGRLTPVYPTTKGLGQNRWRTLSAQLRGYDWPQEEGTPFETLMFLHEPPASTTFDQIDAARERIARDELTTYYLIMRHRQLDRTHQRAIALPRAQQLGRQLLKRLGFRLTGAQRRVVTEVLNDLDRSQPMLRLVQGDVGSGKTVVAAFAAIRCAEHNAQTAIMAPTEILAEQHYLTMSEWLEPLGIRVVLLTGSQSASARKPLRAAMESGEALVAVGTHALFQNTVQFHNLALTIVDEQHRFGVHQRMSLRAKGSTPHQLVMTATPIPRTLTMALYADMDVSIIDELPAGRQPIETRVLQDGRRDDVLRRISAAIARGEQAYWVCALIEDSNTLPARSAETTYKWLIGVLPQAKVGLIHGRMPADEKARVMREFKEHRCQLLVATTVIEVGVDVPNASLMVIENPERLGLAQLHQLRGRIGRGRAKSYCTLLYAEGLSEAGRARLKVIRDSTDGFLIAEQDLKLRGPGELLGARQTGEQQFRVADLREHAHLMPEIVSRGDALLREAPEVCQALLRTWAPADTDHISV